MPQHPPNLSAFSGTALSTTVARNGQVQLSPPCSVYLFGTVIRLTAIPDAGKYFGVWGNAASGTANPLYFTITNPNPTVSSLFAPLSIGQRALTVLIDGPGSVAVNPPGNMFHTSDVVSITATPFAGKGFAGWSGDASGTQNPLSLPMLNDRVVTANFLNWPFLTAGAQNISTQGFKFKLTSGAGTAYEILTSSNLNQWASLGFVTNVTGETEFTDSGATNATRKFYKAAP